jgi:hypothetical protein
MKSISAQQILDFMEEGAAYPRASFYSAFPDVDRKLVNDALVMLTQRGEVWNGNQFSYVKFAQKSAQTSAEPQICPSADWGNLTGYESQLQRMRGAAEATRGPGYIAREYQGNVLSGRQRESFQQRAEVIRGLK